MPAKKPITPGDLFGRWTVVRIVSLGRGSRVFCRCECATEREVPAQGLRSGRSKSCGCFKREFNRLNHPVACFTHGLSRTPEYNAWIHMIHRCQNPADGGYPDYGGRGIKVCGRWQSVENFVADMGPRPLGSTIDRYPNNDGNYEPDNCRWASVRDQNRNYRRNVKITHQGETLCVADWAEKVGIDAKTLYRRVEIGWPTEQLFDPVKAVRKMGSRAD